MHDIEYASPGSVLSIQHASSRSSAQDFEGTGWPFAPVGRRGTGAMQLQQHSQDGARLVHGVHQHLEKVLYSNISTAVDAHIFMGRRRFYERRKSAAHDFSEKILKVSVAAAAAVDPSRTTSRACTLCSSETNNP